MDRGNCSTMYLPLFMTRYSGILFIITYVHIVYDRWNNSIQPWYIVSYQQQWKNIPFQNVFDDNVKRD